MNTLKNLKKIPKKIPKPKIDKSTLWPEHLYHKDKKEKSLIVLHHTDGHGGKEALNYLRITSSKLMQEKGYSVGTAYAIDANSTIYQAFDDSFWAYHTGSGSVHNDSRSVAIEIDNAGFLQKRGNKWFDRYGYNTTHFPDRFKVKVYDHGKKWRGHQFFEHYYEAQIDSLIILLNDIFERYPAIERKIVEDFCPEKPMSAYARNRFSGILAHTHFLPGSRKHDLHPGFMRHFERLVDSLNLEVV